MHKHSTSPFIYVTRIVLLTLLATGCSREVPSSWTIQSPASAEAKAVPTTDVTLSLDSDPPLPGETETSWIGFEQPTTAPDHAGHAGHAGHAAQPEPKARPSDQPKPSMQPEPAAQDAHADHSEHDEHAGHAHPDGAKHDH